MYQISEPININSNEDFSNFGFPGSERSDDPYRIEGVNITQTEILIDLIRVADVKVYFQVANNYLNGGNLAGWGISIWNSKFGIINDNYIVDTGNGISLYTSENIIVTNNVLNNNPVGIRLELNTDFNIITTNIVTSSDVGIWIGNSSNNNTILNNRIYQNSFGISLTNDDGLVQGTKNSNNLILNNTIENNFIAGVEINGISDNNYFSNNSFIGNGRQVIDFGKFNLFKHNYWDDWDEIGSYEVTNGNFDHSPVKITTNNSSISDMDNDGLSDEYEIENGLNPFVDDALYDDDNDGLTNIEEREIGSSPSNADTDGDGINDLYEFENGLNILLYDSNQDLDGDWVSNYEEFLANTKSNIFWDVPLISLSIFHFLLISVISAIFSISSFIYIKLEIKKRNNLITKVNAPDYPTAILMNEGNFDDYNIFLEAKKLLVNTLDDYNLLLELKELEKEENNSLNDL
ncbi:MAG: hypothetical protein HeimC3_48680 [Candidatus Heimdallarchaeota archaeon LC_3]|nr:MAG: hypothetical protein HeimC3_48680 [Candidatus Heimdallarchaeota archaeon LC_3]